MNRLPGRNETVMSLGRMVRRIELRAPLHPIFVHFTVALTGASLACDAIGFIFGVVSLITAGGWALVGSLLMTIFTIVTGVTSRRRLPVEEGEAQFVGLNLRAALFGFVALSLTGAIAQASILHYRGAFNNVAMYAPLTAPTLAVAVSAWATVVSHGSTLVMLVVLLWLTALIGFVGLGMHLRGFDRQMGGLYIPLFNILEGPPAWAPALFVGVATVGLVAVHLL